MQQEYVTTDPYSPLRVAMLMDSVRYNYGLSHNMYHWKSIKSREEILKFSLLLSALLYAQKYIDVHVIREYNKVFFPLPSSVLKIISISNFLSDKGTYILFVQIHSKKIPLKLENISIDAHVLLFNITP